jgi:hypothetical protein
MHKHGSKSLDKLTNPNDFGPGVWQIIHILARKVKTIKEVPQFMITLEIILSSLFCGVCSKHAMDYFTKNSPEQYITLYDTDNNFIGMFYWSWEFHNVVNKRLGKTIMPWKEAFDLFNQQNICDSNCGSGILHEDKSNKTNSNRNDLPITLVHPYKN